MRTFETREDMIRSLVPAGGTYVEVGVFEGTFTQKLMEILKPKKLIAMDIFHGQMGSGDQDGNNFKFVDLSTIYERLKRSETPSFRVWKGWSYDLLGFLDDNEYDMIYLDADHSYEGTIRDLKLAFPKIRNGGWLMGHDYEMNMAKANRAYDFGVRKAVEDFCKEFNQNIFARAMDGCVSFAIRVEK